MANKKRTNSDLSSHQPLRLAIEPMQLDDLPAIMRLETRCFETPWSVEIYRRELTQSTFSFYHVIRPARNAPPTGLTQNLPSILAYGGCWVLGDECHLMTIASHPEWRRRRLSEWLLLNLLASARDRAASRCTLEVRASNRAAIALYSKLGFEQVGRRRGYYPAGGEQGREDALIMTLHGLDTGRVWLPLKASLAALPAIVEEHLLVG